MPRRRCNRWGGAAVCRVLFVPGPHQPRAPSASRAEVPSGRGHISTGPGRRGGKEDSRGNIPERWYPGHCGFTPRADAELQGHAAPSPSNHLQVYHVFPRTLLRQQWVLSLFVNGPWYCLHLKYDQSCVPKLKLGSFEQRCLNSGPLVSLWSIYVLWGAECKRNQAELLELAFSVIHRCYSYFHDFWINTTKTIF